MPIRDPAIRAARVREHRQRVLAERLAAGDLCTEDGCGNPRRYIDGLCQTHRILRTTKPRQCEVCSIKYTPTYGKQRTCSRECGAELRRHKPAVRPCRYCGTAVQTIDLLSRAMCGPDCPARPKPTSRLPREVQCVECGTTFRPTGAAILCSDLCRQERKRRTDREYNEGRRPPTRDCELCGATLSSRVRKRCDGCLVKTRRQRKWRDKRRRRALKLGARSEPYTLAEIAVRDRYRCGLCRKRVAMTQVVPHPKAPTIDHVVPMADGGDDTRANVQLAHFLCNSLKSTRGTQQLALIG